MSRGRYPAATAVLLDSGITPANLVFWTTPMQEDIKPSTVVLLEPGAPWPSWVSACRRPPACSVLVAQPDETTDSFVQRIGQKLGDELKRVALQKAPLTLVLGFANDGAPAEGRVEWARAALSGLAPVPPGRVYLTAAEDLEFENRHSLFDVANALTEALRPGTDVTVRFGTELSSGVHRASAPPPEVITSVA